MPTGVKGVTDHAAGAGPAPDDPDAQAYADGAALPNPGAKLAGPTFKEWLAATKV